METGLAGQGILVTGGSANIGRAISLAFAAEGAKVVIVGRDEEQGRLVATQAIEAGAADAFWLAADVTDRPQVDAMARAALGRFGAIDVLVNNVGGNADFSYFIDSDPATWEQDIVLNLTSTLHCCHALLPSMVARGRGRIINIGSTAGLIGDPMLAVYSAAKGAVHAFTRILAKEVGKQGITVNAIAPYGTLPDDFTRDVSRGSRWHPEGVIARTTAKREAAVGWDVTPCSSARRPLPARWRPPRSTSRRRVPPSSPVRCSPSTAAPSSPESAGRAHRVRTLGGHGTLWRGWASAHCRTTARQRAL